MVIAIILTVWVCGSTLFCLALAGAAAKSVSTDKLSLGPANTSPSGLSARLATAVVGQ